MKLYTYLIHDTKEYYAQLSEDKLYEYLKLWHLYESELDILFQTGVYNHENLGIIEYNILEVE
jgi:hypothetical protein